MNQNNLSGRMVRKPELRHTTNGTPVAAFTIAVDRPGTYGDKKQTDFIDCIAWRVHGENIAKYFDKGDKILLSGHLTIRNWTDNEGTKRRNAEVVVNNWEFIETRRAQDKQGAASDSAYDALGSSGAYTSPVTGSAFAPLEGDDGDLPF